jgi:primosomal protein N' (replication factor Y)
MKVLAAAEGRRLSGAALASAAGVSAGVVKGLVDEGVLAPTMSSPTAACRSPTSPCRPATLNPGQAACVEVLKDMLDAGGFQAALLDGVTGSGKTEVYLEAVAAALAGSRRQVLILLPEIALTQAVLARFEQRFGALPAEWHSGVSPPRRRQVWEAWPAATRGSWSGPARRCSCRSASCAWSWSTRSTTARSSRKRASSTRPATWPWPAPRSRARSVLLASATPSLESLFNAQAGRYRWLRLSARHGAAQLPDIDLIDMRQTPPEAGRWLSPPLIKAMAVTLAARRAGHAVPEPPGLCAARPVQGLRREDEVARHRQLAGRAPLHRTPGLPPDRLFDEEARGLPALRGQGQPGLDRPGVERVEEEARHIFPDARVAVFSSDTVMDADGARTLVETMAAGEIDILVATQAAAKGHNFPNLTLVGVVDADLSLARRRPAGRGADVPAAGPGGRAGGASREAGPGAAADLFARARGDAGPEGPGPRRLRRGRDGHAPGRRPAAVRTPGGGDRLGPDAAALEAYVDALAAVIPNAEGVEVFGPADAPLALVRGRRRKRFLVRAERNVDLQGFMAAWRARAKVPNSVRVVRYSFRTRCGWWPPSTA